MPKVAQLPVEERRPRQRAPDIARKSARQTRYFAFLSYSHKDEKLADWLHSQIENFHVPATLAGRLTGNGVVPKRLTPIFRDRHELAAAGDLGAEIREALAASQFLVVLCSPAAAKSRWTNAEIDTFKRTRPDGCVLAAIVDGEPFASDVPGREHEECFPPALRHRYDRRGRATSKRAEPLAADLRGNGEERRTGLLQLVAGMLGVGLDELVQREQTRRQRRLAWLAAASLAGMAVTSTLAITAFQARNEARDQRREAEGLVSFMLGDLREKLAPIGRLDAIDAVGSRALAYYQRQDKGSLSDEALAQRAKALTLIGEIANTRGDLESALRRYQEALASTAESVRRHPDEPQRLFDHAQNVFWVGYIAYLRGQLDQAAAQFREYKRLAARMVELAPNNKDYRLEQVYADTNLGTVLMSQARYREATRTYRSSLVVAEALAAAEPKNLAYQKQVGDNLAWLGDAYEFSGQLEQALADRERELRLLTDLARTDARDTDIQRDMLTAHRAIGRLLASRGDINGGINASLEAVKIADELFRIEPENTEWLQASAASRFDLADVQIAAGQSAVAAAMTRSGCGIVDRLVSRDSTVANWKSQYRVSCLRLRSRLALHRGDPGEAFNLAKQSLAAARTSPSPLARGMLSFWSLAAGGDSLAAASQADEARKWWSAALQSVPRSVELMPVEQGMVAVLKHRLGDHRGAQQLVSSLDAMGYRHPRYVSAIAQHPRAT